MKVNWLTKVVLLTELVLNEKAEVDIDKIILGEEPDKTNIWL